MEWCLPNIDTMHNAERPLINPITPDPTGLPWFGMHVTDRWLVLVWNMIGPEAYIVLRLQK